ncbi:MAG: 3-dehydroquinate synthase family protein [Acidimicrobiia bacterium]|nr:3-dehydroquinate synthase family protein [Acidimicrobiia bacterium]
MEQIRVADTSTVIFGSGPLLDDRQTRERVVVLTQPGTPAAIARRLAEECECPAVVHELPDRERAKDLETLGEIYDILGEHNVGRHDTVAGVGGGALTDVAGFAAATWLRGVESVLAPTTLLGAVDAAIGGKTGINRNGKNLVGAFWVPTRVLVDLDVLAALPEPLLREGAAEALKAGLLADRAIVDEYDRAGLEADLSVIVPAAIRVKADVVNTDLRESDRRAILNFGHTIGHAVELLAPMSHGHAVSVGMVAAAVISHHRYGFDHRWLTDLLFGMGLPVAAAGVPMAAAASLIERDKKRTADGVRMVLLRDVGEPVVDVVGAEELELGMRAVGLS